jgi:hypothetical protein
VAVEKVQFAAKRPKFGAYKMPRKLRKSFVELLIAKFFGPFFGDRVFQQPRLVSTVKISTVKRPRRCTFVLA